MKAAVFYGRRDVRIQHEPTPRPGPRDVLVQVETAGVCGSEAANFENGGLTIRDLSTGESSGMILGHEFAGTVRAVGSEVTRLRVGARIVSGSGVSCGQCGMCLGGRTNLCVTYYTLGNNRAGGLAEFVAVPESIAFDVSESHLSFDTLAMAQPMAIAVHAVRRSGLRAGDHVVVVGVGGIGAFICYVAAQIGAHVTVADLRSDRLELARAQAPEPPSTLVNAPSPTR